MRNLCLRIGPGATTEVVKSPLELYLNRRTMQPFCSGGTMPDKYCDLVMKGGITSGLIYPRTVLKLAEQYAFKQIGGTSAGAIAAVMTAAAEVGRRGGKAGGDQSFEGLELVTRQLVTKGFIKSLFQPARSASGLLEGLNRMVRSPGAVPAARLVFALSPLAALAGAVAALAVAALLPAVLALILGWEWKTTLLITAAAAWPGMFLGALCIAAWRGPYRAAATLRGNNFGMCSGLSEGRHDALTDWMDGWTRRLAGIEGRPLIFGDLWNAERYRGEPASKRAVDLVVFSSNVSYREPHRLPFEGKRFFFLVREWRDILQLRAPGYRDRIAHVPLFSGEGGLNLDMPVKVLEAVARRGAATGDMILKAFDFENHYWVRYRSSISGLQSFAEGIVKVVATPPLKDYQGAWEAMRRHGPYPSYAFTKRQSDLSREWLKSIEVLTAAGDGKVTFSYKTPKPAGDLRITPRL
jgi:hypothetical protein